MLRKIFSILLVFFIIAVVLLNPLTAQSDPATPEEIAHMKAGHKKVEVRSLYRQDNYGRHAHADRGDGISPRPGCSQSR